MNAAIAVTAYEQADLVEIDPPPVPGPGQVVGRTLYSLMSPGTELAWFYHGRTFPGYPGYAAVFEVTEVGAGVEELQPGEILFCMGAHRTWQCVAAQEAVIVPPELAPEVAPLARLMGVSMTTLMTTTARPGERIIVTGLGPVGFLAAQIFHLSGYAVMGVEPDIRRRELLPACGITEVYPRIPVKDPDLQGDVALVVECSGHEAAVLDACQVVRRRGEVVLVGVPWQPQTTATAHELLHLVFHKYVVLRSGWEWELPRQRSDFAPCSIFGNFATALEWLAEGRLQVEGHWRLVDPHDAQAAYQDHLHHRTSELFTLFDWTTLTDEGEA